MKATDSGSISHFQQYLGEDVYTVVNEAELNHFMGLRHNYEKFVVQRLIGHADWYSTLDDKQFRHVGTIPDSQQHSYVADLRFMVVGGSEGFLPVAIYARRAREPLGSVVDSASRLNLDIGLSQLGSFAILFRLGHAGDEFVSKVRS